MNSCHLASHFRSGVGATQARPPVSETLREWSRRPSETGLGDPPRVVSETLRDRSRRVSETDIYDMRNLGFPYFEADYPHFPQFAILPCPASTNGTKTNEGM